MEQLIIGTAGHVDHGKTVLIKALTGVDTDRLQEEKERGISIDLGFAPFRLPGGRLAGIVDVPGHERFIHNMLAGAAGMDLVLLVVDAAEGVMPQTREHMDILQLLGISRGVVVITKIDLVEEEWQELVRDEIKEELQGTFLEGAPLVAVSAHQGLGIETLKQVIDDMTAGLETSSANGPLRLPVDRVFVIPGFGTVVTGTMRQGAVQVGDMVEVVPPGLEARVRNIQVHDHDVKTALAGSRVALNLSGLEKSQVQRGSVVSKPGSYRPTGLLDVSLRLLDRAPRHLKNLAPVHFFLGTARSTARLLILDADRLDPGGTALVQCRLDQPLVAERGDPFVIRSYSPMTTIGGGIVLDPYPARHRRFRPEVIEGLKELLVVPSAGGDTAFLRAKLKDLKVVSIERFVAETRLDPGQVETTLTALLKEGQVEKVGAVYLEPKTLRELEQRLLHALDEHHRLYPLSKGASRARLHRLLPAAFGQRDYEALLADLQKRALVEVGGDLVCRFGFQPEPSEKDSRTIDQLVNIYLSASLQPPSVKNALQESGAEPARKDEYYGYLVAAGVLVKINEELYFHRHAYDKALDILCRHFSAEDRLTLAQFRDLSGSSRKYAQALLEHFDQAKYTRRIEDHRVPLRLRPPGKEGEPDGA